MTDWERVEKLRAKGLSWEEIATDDKVEFAAPEGTEKPGLALKALYFQRRSRTKRQAKSGVPSAEGGGQAAGGTGGFTRKKLYRLLAVLGILIALVGALPYLVNFEFPVVSAASQLIPTVLLAIAIVGIALLAFAFISGGQKVLRVWKKGLISGVIIGLVLTGVLVLLAGAAGCPSLTSAHTGELGPTGDSGWFKVNNPMWTRGGLPVFFYYGSIACPYCSASSWAFKGALVNYSSALLGVSFGTSDPGDVYPNTPEVNFVSSSTNSQYLSWDPHETSDDSQITLPAVSCPESAYVSAYNTGPQAGIPFIVVGGIYVHTGSLVSPGQLRSDPTQSSSTPLSPQTVAQDLVTCGNNPSSGGSDCQAILPAQFWLEAYIAKVLVDNGQTPPSQYTTPGTVVGNDYIQIT
ncbi:MAG: DUF929 family protein [Euryarchaeota archaeon]|nr:DUF929 family protein [Euryarchaeota archaeon]MDE1836375.1 DUF929 family protein [Euryarchaeota archaeon]MDE2044229.1 DUF929 family protein [Thermoplasmata archaeon]